MARPLAPRGRGRERVVDAALELFAQHGVSGTSLQMIADHLGVTKAAVYYQFKAKEDIVLAVLEPAFRTMRDFIAEAEAAPSPAESSERAMAGLVDLIIEQRQVVAALFRHPKCNGSSMATRISSHSCSGSARCWPDLNPTRVALSPPRFSARASLTRACNPSSPISTTPSCARSSCTSGDCCGPRTRTRPRSESTDARRFMLFSYNRPTLAACAPGTTSSSSSSACRTGRRPPSS